MVAERRIAVQELANRVSSLEKCMIKLVSKDELLLEKLESVASDHKEMMDKLVKVEEMLFGNLGNEGIATKIATVDQRVSWILVAAGSLMTLFLGSDKAEQLLGKLLDWFK